MSDRMHIIPFADLIRWIFEEYANDRTIFGISESKFYKQKNNDPTHIFSRKIELPLGPAAGPQTQLAQNIITAYLVGARFFELKTVQVIDGHDLQLAKPCILVDDEGYNTEWSTELTVSQALHEYIKAWFALSILAQEFGLGHKDGFLFNLSVGYDYDGITHPKIDRFIEGLKNASSTAIWPECRNYVLTHLNQFNHISADYVDSISPTVSNSVTLSTLHGCPPEEIEKIARHLIAVKKLHTFIKCNPTLLGYDFVRKTLDTMGYGYISFDDRHFRTDLQFSDAIPMFKRLQEFANEHQVEFGLKISNTLPVNITNHELPGNEMYLSGKALYPLAINLACRLAEEFHGELRISYAGGVDAFNIKDICESGLLPVTCVTTILKPGGYTRFYQLAQILEKCNYPKTCIPINVEKLKRIAADAIMNEYYLKHQQTAISRKLSLPVPLIDCFIAPCTVSCPINQDVPEYIRLVDTGKYGEAISLITKRNPLPFITGTLCTHPCMEKCSRIDYDESVFIRHCKLIAAEHGFPQFIRQLSRPALTTKSKCKVAIIGGGPAGMAAGYFLRLSGIEVTLFETRNKLGGIVEHIIPNFRISRTAIENDVKLLELIGVTYKLNYSRHVTIDEYKKKGFKYIVLAIGASVPGSLKLEQCDRELINALTFLASYNQGTGSVALGKRVAVVGGGNTALDAARTAKRINGVEEVYLVYRRTIKFMPADREELELAFADGIKVIELVTPISFINGILTCQKMKLGNNDTSGRPIPIPIPNELIEIQVDSVILAIGEKVDSDYLFNNHIQLDETGKPIVSPDNETSIQNVYIIGDAHLGPSSIIECIAEGFKVARTIVQKELNVTLDLSSKFTYTLEQIAEINLKKGILKTKSENKPCLECNYLCNICSEVCPNRANVQIRVPGLKNFNQILHIDALCNECGNCATFCPYSSSPYNDKFTFFWTLSDFESSKNDGFVSIDKNKFKIRLLGSIKEVTFNDNGTWDYTHGYTETLAENIRRFIWTTYTKYNFLFINAK
ncbi:MAG: putative selenate reductase subunit YgfK [bacterium]|nr:putative selenate reductase subunit YgfK [bacterium]